MIKRVHPEGSHTVLLLQINAWPRVRQGTSTEAQGSEQQIRER